VARDLVEQVGRVPEVPDVELDPDGVAADLVDLPAAVRTVRRLFPAWNLVVVAIVTAWAVGLCGLGLALVGVVPGILYAMLVSAHATASLADA